jgi:preprotein translocase subunit SecA
MKAEIPVSEAEDVQAAQQQRTARNYQEQKEESRYALAGGYQGTRPPVQQNQPVHTQKIASRNQRVNVQYADGSMKKDVKFKTVEDDIKNNKCVIVE